MPSYKLTFLPFPGLAEPICFLFRYAGIEFEDERISLVDILKLKETTPFGQLPVLEVDGKRVDQSIAICRYLAKKCNLAGKDDWESLEIDSTVDTITDLRTKIDALFRGDHIQAEGEKLSRETVTYYLERLDAQVKENGGYFVGGALTWADLTFVGLWKHFSFNIREETLENYANLKQLKKKIEEIPAIKSWIERLCPYCPPDAICRRRNTSTDAEYSVDSQVRLRRSRGPRHFCELLQ